MAPGDLQLPNAKPPNRAQRRAKQFSSQSKHEVDGEIGKVPSPQVRPHKWEMRIEATVHGARAIGHSMFPLSGEAHRTSLFYFIFGIPFGLIILGLEMTSHYEVVEWAFILTALSYGVLAWISLEILKRAARLLWTFIVSGTVVGCLFYLYVLICPNLTIKPNNLRFGVGDLYPFTLSNPSDTDKFAAAFIIRINPKSYSADDFELLPEKNSVQPLGQQSADDLSPMSDVFGFRGRDWRGEPILVLYVYHLAPQESRKFDLKFNLSKASNGAPGTEARILSYSTYPVPVNKQNGVVAIPFGVENSLTIESLFHCTLQQEESRCSFNSVGAATEISEPGCYYIAFRGHQNLPGSIANPNFNGSCDLRKFRTW